jgi:hypothetical protein
MPGFLGSFLVVGGLYLYMVILTKRTFSPGEIIFFAVFFMPILFWSLFRVMQIIRSIRRYNARRSFRPA